MSRIRSRRRRTAVGGPPATFAEGFDLRCGPFPDLPHRPAVFATDAERRAAWERHGAWMLDHDARPGRRPEAFWQYEPGIPASLRPRHADHHARLGWLASHGHVAPAETRAIERIAADTSYAAELARADLIVITGALA